MVSYVNYSGWARRDPDRIIELTVFIAVTAPFGQEIPILGENLYPVVKRISDIDSPQGTHGYANRSPELTITCTWLSFSLARSFVGPPNFLILRPLKGNRTYHPGRRLPSL